MQVNFVTQLVGLPVYQFKGNIRSMIKCLKIRKVAIFLILFILILCLNPSNLNNKFILISFAQETGEIIETIETQENHQLKRL